MYKLIFFLLQDKKDRKLAKKMNDDATEEDDGEKSKKSKKSKRNDMLPSLDEVDTGKKKRKSDNLQEKTGSSAKRSRAGKEGEVKEKHTLPHEHTVSKITPAQTFPRSIFLTSPSTCMYIF